MVSEEEDSGLRSVGVSVGLVSVDSVDRMDRIDGVDGMDSASSETSPSNCRGGETVDS